MQLSTRCRYAVMAMADLAARSAAGPVDGALDRSLDRPVDRPVNLGEIAASQQLSQCYLEQLFGALRRAGLVVSARGPSGGYRLARPAAQMSIATIMLAVDEPIRATRCAPDAVGCLRGADGQPVACVTHDLWSELGRQIDLFLAGITLADVIEGRVLGRAGPIATCGKPTSQAHGELVA